MRYDEFRNRWQGALQAAGLLSHSDRPEETIDLATTARRWEVHLLPRGVEPFSVGTTVSFRWDPFDSARSYTCEEDLLTELLGRGARRTTQRRLLRVDITLGASLPHGSSTPMPASDLWVPWVASVEDSLDEALTPKRRRRTEEPHWRGDLEIAGRTTARSTSPRRAPGRHRECPHLQDSRLGPGDRDAPARLRVRVRQRGHKDPRPRPQRRRGLGSERPLPDRDRDRSGRLRFGRAEGRTPPACLSLTPCTPDTPCQGPPSTLAP